jgi:hypothetical protein
VLECWSRHASPCTLLRLPVQCARPECIAAAQASHVYTRGLRGCDTFRMRLPSGVLLCTHRDRGAQSVLHLTATRLEWQWQRSCITLCGAAAAQGPTTVPQGPTTVPQTQDHTCDSPKGNRTEYHAAAQASTPPLKRGLRGRVIFRVRLPFGEWHVS